MAATGTLGLAGCSALGGSGGVSLAGLRVQSPLADPHEVAVRLDRDGETVLDRRVAVGGDDDALSVQADWDTDPATYELTYAVAGPEVDLSLRTWSLDGSSAPKESDCAVAVLTLVTDPWDETFSSVAGLRPGSYYSDFSCP